MIFPSQGQMVSNTNSICNSTHPCHLQVLQSRHLGRGVLLLLQNSIPSKEACNSALCLPRPVIFTQFKLHRQQGGDFPGQNTGAGSRFLLQGTFLPQGLNSRLLHWQADSLPLHHQGSPRLLVGELNLILLRDRQGYSFTIQTRKTSEILSTKGAHVKRCKRQCWGCVPILKGHLISEKEVMEERSPSSVLALSF